MKKLLFLCGVISFISLHAQQRSPALDSLLKITDSAVLKTKIAALEKGSENDLQSLATFYNIRRKYDQAQVVYALAAERFPTSFLAFYAAWGKIRNEEDATKRRQLFVTTKTQFAQYSKEVDFQFMAANLAQKSIDDKRLNDALYYLESIQFASMYASIARGIYSLNARKGEELLKNYINTHPKPVGSEILVAYTNILVSSGRLKEASAYAKEAYPKSRRNTEFINDYVRILQKEGDYQEIVNVLENAVVDGMLTRDIKKVLLAAYQKQGLDGDASFQMIIERYRQKLKTELAKKLINKPSPAFVLKDENGHNVSLDDFKGKTIVLDFWATWCVPCKKSFPAMQMALDRYKGDSSVKFLFIHTWDKGSKDPQKDASTYLRQNNYTFDLYMDYKDPVTDKHPTVSSFEVSGIPTKFVIDGNGNIRFKVDGFSGMDEAATEEVITLIELAKTTK